MSAAQSSGPAAAASARAPFKKRPRHFWEGPDSSDEPEEEKQGAAHVAPIARLYRHALESVFGFLTLADLSRVLSVSRSWSAAVRSMQTIGASLVVRPPLPHVIAVSSLASHVNSLSYEALSSSDLFILSRHFSSLTSLWCKVELAHTPRLNFAPTLRSLSLQLNGTKKHTPTINGVIAVLSQLPVLENLTLELAEFAPTLNLAPLAAARLQNLILSSQLFPFDLTLPQLDQLRTLPHLRKMAVPGLSNKCLVSLLRTPHSLQWQEIHTLYRIDDPAATALSTLPTLTALDTRGCRSLAFLPSLTRLRTVALRMDYTLRLATDIVAGLSCCVEIEDLLVTARDVTSKHLSQALSHMSLLHKLELVDCSALESLSFLPECAHLSLSLQSFWMQGCRNAALHSTDLKHVLTLKNLSSLGIDGSFVEPLDACTQHLFQPPSSVLPALFRFSYHHQ